MANLLFSPGLFNKNWKNHVLYLIAVDLINVAITFAARIPFFFFYSRHFEHRSPSFDATRFSYFYIALTIRFGGRFDGNESESRYSSTISSAGYAFVSRRNGRVFTRRRYMEN